MKKKILKQITLLVFAYFAMLYGKAQYTGISTAAPDASSKMEISPAVW